MSKKRTNTKAGSSTHSRTTRRVSKRQLFRAKVATAVGAAVLFLASLAGIAIYNPQVGNQAAAALQTEQITIVEPSGSRSLLLAPPPRVSAVRPLVRSRGS